MEKNIAKYGKVEEEQPKEQKETKESKKIVNFFYFEIKNTLLR